MRGVRRDGLAEMAAVWSHPRAKICGGCQSFIWSEGAKPGQRRRASGAEGLGPCPVGVPGFESPPPHQTIEPTVLPAEIAARILEHALWLKREGYRAATIRGAVKTLKALGRRCNILEPEQLKDYLSRAHYGENHRDKILGDMVRFYKSLNVQWYRPLSRRVETLPFVPLESEIDSLIGGLGPKLSAFTRVVKETGARPMEIFQLRWTDVDAETNTINITPEKGSRPRRP
jgi:integrase